MEYGDVEERSLGARDSGIPDLRSHLRALCADEKSPVLLDFWQHKIPQIGRT
jgi:hypothetical protein